MADTKKQAAIVARDAPIRTRPSVYPPPFDQVVTGRVKQPLGDLFGLTNFGVNLTRLRPGAATALRHAHGVRDEFVYVLEGEPTLVTDDGELLLSPGMCAGFKGGLVNAHHFVNQGERDAVILEIGDRSLGDSVCYPDDDLSATVVDGGWCYTRKDGTPY